jgi:hypothetical protein
MSYRKALTISSWIAVVPALFVYFYFPDVRTWTRSLVMLGFSIWYWGSGDERHD